MTSGLDSFHKLTSADAFRAGEAMADAFGEDPLWRKVFEGESGLQRKYQACFEVPMRHCLHFGEVYATSEELEGIAATVPGEHASMSFRTMLRSGALLAGLRMGAGASRRMVELKVLDSDRKQIMEGRSYLYLLVLGVRTAHQGKGFGGLLLRGLTETCDEADLPLYLETETEDNVSMYQHFGFDVIQRITLDKLGLPMWEMVREPRQT